MEVQISSKECYLIYSFSFWLAERFERRDARWKAAGVASPHPTSVVEVTDKLVIV